MIIERLLQNALEYGYLFQWGCVLERGRFDIFE